MSKMHNIPYEVQENLSSLDVIEKPLTRSICFTENVVSPNSVGLSPATIDFMEIKDIYVCPLCGANFHRYIDAEKHLCQRHHISNAIQKSIPQLMIKRREIYNIC